MLLFVFADPRLGVVRYVTPDKVERKVYASEDAVLQEISRLVNLERYEIAVMGERWVLKKWDDTDDAKEDLSWMQDQEIPPAKPMTWMEK